MELLDWFREKAPEKSCATILGGVPTHWRKDVGDARLGEEWAKVFILLRALVLFLLVSLGCSRFLRRIFSRRQ